MLASGALPSARPSAVQSAPSSPQARSAASVTVTAAREAGAIVTSHVPGAPSMRAAALTVPLPTISPCAAKASSPSVTGSLNATRNVTVPDPA